MPAGMLLALLLGAGDVATGVALRLHRAGLAVALTELPDPLAVRRTVSFAEAVHAGTWSVEGVLARRAGSLGEALALAGSGLIPVVVAPDPPRPVPLPVYALVDARMRKVPPALSTGDAPLVIGLGPGFEAGRHCHAVVETRRGHTLGRVLWSGAALPDTALPEGDPRRVLRAPVAGEVTPHARIGERVERDQLIATVAGIEVRSPLAGVLRGLIRAGTRVTAGLKIGDVDARDEAAHYCHLVSDRALAIGGGVLEAILSRPEARARLAASPAT